jgi:hypothetical protein
MGLTLDYKKLDELLKNMEYMNVSGRYYEIVKCYPFENTSFGYRESENSDLIRIGPTDFSIYINGNSYLSILNKHGSYMDCEFYNTKIIEISKLFATLKDVLNSLSFGEDRRVLEYKQNRDSTYFYLLWSTFGRLLDEKCLTRINLYNISKHRDQDFDLTYIWKKQYDATLENNSICLGNGGIMRFYELITIDVREAIIGL